MTPTPDSAAQGGVATDPAYMEWPALNVMLQARFSDDDRDDNDLCVTRAEACALLSWARLFEHQAQPRRDEEERTYDIIRRAAALIETAPPAQQAGVERPSPAPSEDSASFTDGDTLPQPSDMATALALTATPETFPHDSYSLAVWLDKALATATPAIPATSTGSSGEVREPTDAQVREAMQTAWDDFCDDAKAHPDDIYREGRSTFFRAGTWADHTAMHLRAALAASSTSGLTDGGDLRAAYIVGFRDGQDDGFSPDTFLAQAALAQPDAVISGMPDRGEGA